MFWTNFDCEDFTDKLLIIKDIMYFSISSRIEYCMIFLTNHKASRISCDCFCYIVYPPVLQIICASTLKAITVDSTTDHNEFRNKNENILHRN